MPSQNLAQVGRWSWWKPANADCQYVYTTTTKIDSQLLLASTSSNVLLGPGSEEAFKECLGGKQCLPLSRLGTNLATYRVKKLTRAPEAPIAKSF